MSTRSFEIETPKSVKGGRYIGNPQRVASKAATRYFNKNKNRKTVNVKFQETTRGSAEKKYTYKVTKKALTEEEKKKLRATKMGFVPKFKTHAKRVVKK